MTMPIRPERAMDSQTKGEETRPMGGRISVVLADDHPLVRRILTLQFESDGLDVVGEACNGREAIELVRSLRPDVVVLDHRMPELDGLGAARSLLADRSDLRIIILTSDDDARVAGEAARIGARAYVLKQDTADHLIRIVHLVADGGTGPEMRLPPEASSA
jgi:DNA-binding NarL/FixJ family response regulator